MTIEEKRRELFEAWVDGQGWPQKHTMRHELYLAFNAALDAVTIELPEPAGDPAYNAGIDAMLSAIESTGLGLRVEP